MNAKCLSFLGLLIVGCTAQVELGDRGTQGGSAAVTTGGSGSGGQPGTQAAMGGQTTLLVACGDGILEGIEQCDDGNTLSGDGCSSTCQTEACAGSSSGCISTAQCGNGKVEPSETCDDGNTLSGDGCSSTCQTEAGWYCPTPGQPCIQQLCGDGIVEANEQCDLGAQNGVSGSSCTANCQLPGSCGDGLVQAPEQCDYGTADNDGSYGGCSPNCTLAPYCGDGTVQTQYGEACDMGSQNGTSVGYCTKACSL
jgi:cysteine-rich repeat protein